MAVVTDRADAAVSYSSEAAAQEVWSRRSCFASVRHTVDQVAGWELSTDLAVVS